MLPAGIITQDDVIVLCDVTLQTMTDLNEQTVTMDIRTCSILMSMFIS